jgi:hypothetical protein
MGEPGTAEGEKGGGAFEGEGSSSAVLCLAKDDCVGARYCVPCTAMLYIGPRYKVQAAASALPFALQDDDCSI